MPDREKLKSALETLHEELEGLENLDPTVQQQLATAIGDIESALESDDPQTVAADAEESIGDRLANIMQHYEESHPTLSGLLGSVIDTLSRMGI